MQNADYLQLLVDYIHSATLATIGADGHPQTRIIDMMSRGYISSPPKARLFTLSLWSRDM